MTDPYTTPTPAEQEEIKRANASGKQPVVFVHGLWLLDSSWDRWAAFFEDAGTRPSPPAGRTTRPPSRTPTPDPEVFADKSVGDVAAYQQTIIERLDRKPAIIGHSFGGLLVQILAGRGLSAATAPSTPAITRVSCPCRSPRSRPPPRCWSNPANRHRAVTLTFDQFRFGFANAVTDDEAHELYEQFHVAGSGVPLFQAAFANLNPGTEAKAEKSGDDRGPMLVVSGELDHQAPHAIAWATYNAQKKNEHFVTEFVEIPNRGHSLTIDSGWQEVAQSCLEFVSRFAK